MNFLTASVDVTVDDAKLPSQLGRIRSRVTATVTKIEASFRRMASSFKMAFDKMVRYAKIGALAITGALAYFVKAAMRQEDATKRLEITLRATSHAAGFTAKQLAAQADSLQKITRFSNEAVTEMQTMLLTFKNIKGDVFERATMAVLDMSTAMAASRGTAADLSSATIQLGKALNDPILGVTALSRVGIQFTEQQKDLIKGLVESGRLMEAQAIILQELESEFGGMAQDVDTTSGALKQMWNAVGDVAKVIGQALLPGITKTAKAIKKWAEDNQKRIGYWARVTVSYMNFAKNVFFDFMQFLKKDYAGAWGLVWDTLVETMKLAVKEIVTISIAAGKGIWAGIKAGLLPSKEDVDAIMKEYLTLGGKLGVKGGKKVGVKVETQQPLGPYYSMAPTVKMMTVNEALWAQAKALVEQQAAAKKTESIISGLGGAMAQHVDTYTKKIKELVTQSGIDITESHRQLLSDLKAIESEYQPTLWQRMKEDATEAYEWIKAKAQELQEHIRKTQTETANQTRKLTKVQEEMYSQMAAGSAREFSSTIDQMLFETKRLKDAMVDMVRSILRMIVQIMVFKKIAEPLAYGILGLPVPGTEAATAAHVPAVQTGGYVERGGLAKIHTGETVLPAGRTGTPDITINMVNQSGRPLQATEARGQFLGMKEFVIDVVVDDIARYGKSRQAIGTMLKRT